MLDSCCGFSAISLTNTTATFSLLTRLHRCPHSPSLHQYLHVPRPAARLQSSRAPYLHASTFLRPQHASRPLCLRIVTPAARLKTSIPPRRHTCSMPPELQASIPLCRYACSAPPDLHTSIPPFLRIAAPVALLPRSIHARP